MKLKCRFIDRIGTPGVTEYHERADLEEILSGSESLVYIDLERAHTDPLIIPDGNVEITVVSVPQDRKSRNIPFIGMFYYIGHYVDKAIKSLYSVDIPEYNMSYGDTAKSIRGSGNSLRADGRVPVVLGNVLVAPDWCGIPYSSYDGDDQYFHQLFCFGYNNMTLFDLKIGANRIENYDDLSYANDFTYYPSLISETNITVKLDYNDSQTYTTPDKTYQINVGLAFYSGLRQYTDNGGTTEFSVQFQIRYKLTSSSSWTTHTVTMEGDKDYAREMFSYIVASGEYEVEVTRLTEDSDSGTILDSAYWDVMQALIASDYTGINPLDPSFPTDCKVVSMKIKATNQLNGVIDELNAIAQTNYRDWNGLGSGPDYWVDANTRNPASTLLYLLTNVAVCKRPQDDSEIVWEEFEAFWTWCNDKGFYFDLVSSDYTTGQIVSYIEVATRCTVTRFTGKWGIIIDQEKNNIDFLLTPRNTKGTMTMTKPFGATTKNLECSFRDRESDFVETTRICSLDSRGDIVWDSEQDGETETLDFIGVTDARQMAMIAAFTIACYQRRNIAFSVPQDWEAMTCYPGAVGYIASDMFLYSRSSANVKGISGQTGAYIGISIDTEVTFSLGESYSCLIRLNDPSDSGKIIPLVNPTSESTPTIQSSFLEFASSTDLSIEAGNLITFGLSGKEGLKTICKSIQSETDQGGTLALIPYAEEVFLADSGSIPAFSSGITKRVAGGTGANRTDRQLIELADGLAGSAADVPTYEELRAGFENSYGTQIPESPILVLAMDKRSARLYCSVQPNLTAPHKWDIQVSENQSTWYPLGNDGTNWRTGAAGEYTTVTLPAHVQPNIPNVNTNGVISGRTLYWRMRVHLDNETLSPYISDWSNIVTGTTVPIAYADMGPSTVGESQLQRDSVSENILQDAAVTAGKIATGVLESLVANIHEYITISENGFEGANYDLSDGAHVYSTADRRAYIDQDELTFQAVTAVASNVPTWSDTIKIGGVGKDIEFFQAGSKVGYGLDTNGIFYFCPYETGLATSLFTLPYAQGAVIASDNGLALKESDNDSVIGYFDLNAAILYWGGRIQATGDIKSSGTAYWGDDKEIVQFSDAWLRLNPDGDFSSGIYCGSSLLRTDGELQVGASGASFRVTAAGAVTIAGALVSVGSTDQVTNLNAQYLGGYAKSSSEEDIGNQSGAPMTGQAIYRYIRDHMWDQVGTSVTIVKETSGILSITNGGTVTITHGDSSATGYASVYNNSTTSNATVTDGTVFYTLTPGQRADFGFRTSSTLLWLSPGWELIYTGSTYGVTIYLENGLYRIHPSNGSDFRTGLLHVNRGYHDCRAIWDTSAQAIYIVSTNSLISGNGGYPTRAIYKWHNGE